MGTGRMMTAMALTTTILFTVFITGVVAGITGVITMAVHRTERNHALTLPAADPVTQTGRWLNGVYVRTPAIACEVCARYAPGQDTYENVATCQRSGHPRPP